MPILKNTKHELFCQAIVEGKGIGEAYVIAGYTEHAAYQNGSRLIRKDNIAARIEEMRSNLEKKIESKTGVSKAYVIERLQENLERSLQKIPVLDNEGNETGEYRYEGNVANRALELIGKELGMFQGRTPTGEPGNPNITGIIVTLIKPND